MCLCVSGKDKALFYRSCQPENYFYGFIQMNLYKNQSDREESLSVNAMKIT